MRSGIVLYVFLIALMAPAGTKLSNRIDPIPTKFCTDNYPYTYSKCQKICSGILNPTCVDDQLCFCNAAMSLVEGSSEIFSILGVEDESKCYDSEFCDTLCLSHEHEDGRDLKFNYGVVCSSFKEPNVKVCVCGV